MSEATVPSSGSCGCGSSCACAGEARSTAELVVVWQRLLIEDTTCPRCGTTQQAVRHAVEALTEALRPLGITPRLEERALDQATFEASPGESNRIWIGDRPLEEWLGASVGASRCCSVCGDDECRTLDVDGATFEAVPEHLIIKAGLLAAASLLAA